MKFWKENRLNGEFDWPVQAVADAFCVWYLSQSQEYRDYMPLERALRDWLTDPKEFNSTWEAETGPDSFEELFSTVYGLI